QTENRTLRQQNASLLQEVLHYSSEIEKSNADQSLLKIKIRERDGEIRSLGESRLHKEIKIWAGTTQTGSIVLYDHDCQLNYGQNALFFLPNVPGYRVFDRSYMRARLKKVSDEELSRYRDAYIKWLSQPTNGDIQKEGIA